MEQLNKERINQFTNFKDATNNLNSFTLWTPKGQAVKQMQQKGYKEAQILESDGRFRVAINRYTNQTDAYKQIKELKKNADFASAWVLTTK